MHSVQVLWCDKEVDWRWDPKEPIGTAYSGGHQPNQMLQECQRLRKLKTRNYANQNLIAK